MTKNQFYFPFKRYKERFKDKYLTKNPNSTEKLFDAKQWIFIKDGLDDFRDGLPPPHENLIIKVGNVTINLLHLTFTIIFVFSQKKGHRLL